MVFLHTRLHNNSLLKSISKLDIDSPKMILSLLSILSAKFSLLYSPIYLSH